VKPRPQYQIRYLSTAFGFKTTSRNTCSLDFSLGFFFVLTFTFFASASFECNGLSEIIYYQSNDLAEINRAFPGGDWETKTLLVEILIFETTTPRF